MTTPEQVSDVMAQFGRMARGVPKRYSEAERAKRRERMAELRKRRWPVKQESNNRQKKGKRK